MSNATNIEQVRGALVAFDRVAAGLSELKDRFGGVVYDVRTTEGLETAREARRALREPRYEVERIRKDAKKPLLELGKQIDGEAKRITDAILAIEDPIDAQIRGEEQRREAERQAKVEAERKRVEAIRRRIDAIRGIPPALALSSSNQIALRMKEIAELLIDDSFAEFVEEATRVRHEAYTTMQRMHEAAQQQEAEAARIAAERAELERLRAEQAERDRVEHERREAEAKAERERLAAERAELDRQRAEQEARLRAEREAFEAERAAAKAAAEAELAEARAAEEAARQPEPPTPAAPAMPVPERPEANVVVALVATTYGVTNDVAEAWLRELFGTKARRKAA